MAVADTEYYDRLNVRPTASELEIKKSYRRLAIVHHPDKNPGDETAHLKFQQISEAYQVLSNKDLRAHYDKHGKDKAVPEGGFEDPAEFFGMIFGGEAFKDWIGEISLMKDLTKTMEITMRDMDLDDPDAVPDMAKAEAAAQAHASAHAEAEAGVTHPEAPPAYDPTSTPSNMPHERTNSTHDSAAYEKMGSAAYEKTGSAAYESPPKAAFVSGDEKMEPPSSGYTPSTSASSTSASTPTNSGGIPYRPALTNMTDEEARAEALSAEAAEKKGGKKGLTKEQREELAAYERERREIREKRVKTLMKNLIDKVSVLTEVDRPKDVAGDFEEKIKFEVENLKMESFGIEILHSIGQTYLMKSTTFLKSQKFLGVQGFFSRLKDKGTVVKDTWNTISSAIDAQIVMEEMAKMEEKGGEDWTDEKKVEYERKVTGKILMAAWRGSRFEIQGVLRDVCDKVLYDKSVSLEKRIQRAEALVIIGRVFSAAERDPDDEAGEGVFESLVAEASKPDKDKKKKKEKEKRKASSVHSSADASV